MIPELVVSLVVGGSVLALLVILAQLQKAWGDETGAFDREAHAQALARMWPTLGLFELSVGVLLALWGQWVSAVPLLLLGVLLLLKRPGLWWLQRRHPSLRAPRPGA